MATTKRDIVTLLVFLISLLVLNEFLVYYVVLFQCSWPVMDSVSSSGPQPVRAMFLADTHILGVREGHWFDKLRREWQMERSYQTALTLFNPDVVFFLGDLFDEGKWATDDQFQTYLDRFNHMFRTPEHIQTEVVVGNHDVGFHYMINKHKLKRFNKAFTTPSVRKIHVRDNIFVLMNSMAFEGDNCDMCAEAERQMWDIARELDCAERDFADPDCENMDRFTYSPPILLQHFPMFRDSDANCTGPDSAPLEEKHKLFKPKMDCLSRRASTQLFRSLKPRLILTGHTHHFCHRVYENGIEEWTVPSFSWRNRPNPSLLLTALKQDEHSVSKCFLPHEGTVINMYIIGGVLFVLWVMFRVYRAVRRKFTRNLKIN